MRGVDSSSRGTGATGKAALAAALALAIFSRFRRKKATPAAADAPSPPPRMEGGTPPSPLRAPARKGEVSRPKPRRKPYTGPRLKIIVPGRRGNPGTADAPARIAPPPAPDAAGPDAPMCPACGARPPEGGGICHRCRAHARLAETENLISSLRLKGVEVLDAESFLYQARSAMALEALADVEMLCDRAETVARRLDSDFDEATESLSSCANAIDAAIGSGKDTAGAENALERAGALFRQGDYVGAMEQGALIPLLISGQVGQGAAASAPAPASPSRSPDGIVPANSHPSAPAPDHPPATPDPRTISDTAYGTHRCTFCGERMGEMDEACPRCGTTDGPEDGAAWPTECPICGEPLEPDWKSCPNCSALIDDEGPLSRCPACVRELLPKWKICPYCDTDLPKPAAPAARPRPKRAARNEAPVIPAAMRERGLLEQIGQVDRLLDTASKKGLDVTKGRNLLELAVSFTRSRNYEKGERYVRKARNVAETMLSI